MNLTERFRYRCPACARETITGDELRGQGDLSELAERLAWISHHKLVVVRNPPEPRREASDQRRTLTRPA
jgi:hypothetical protein